MPKSKILIGVPFYGRAWTLDGKNGGAVRGKYSTPANPEDGLNDYDYIMEIVKNTGTKIMKSK